MKSKYKRLFIIIAAFCFFNGLTFFTLITLRESISFFHTVSEAIALTNAAKSIRIGGIVVANSIKHIEDKLTFQVTDSNNNINVIYKGVLPPMFSENNHIIIQGIMIDKNTFLAEMVFAKHDENYIAGKKK